MQQDVAVCILDMLLLCMLWYMPWIASLKSLSGSWLYIVALSLRSILFYIGVEDLGKFV